MNSATETIRAMLDERGVEHKDFEMPDRSMTLFTGGEHDGAYTEDINGTILVAYDLTPEQAVEATLGRWTCRMEPFIYDDTGAFIECSECGWQLFDADYSIDAAREWLGYCPNCGRKVRA